MKVKIRLVISILIAILVCQLLSPERGQLSGLTFGVFNEGQWASGLP